MTPAGLPPSQPPHPELLTAKITSLLFRIWRTQWNGIPIKHYVFELAEDLECAVLNNLDWTEVPSVIVKVNSTFDPYVDFLRGAPFKGGLGPALPAGARYHYRVKAVNIAGQESVYSNFFRWDIAQTGVIEQYVFFFYVIFFFFRPLTSPRFSSSSSSF